MAQFLYTALGGENEYTKGKVEARNIKKARLALEQRGLLVINIKLEEKAGNDWFQKLTSRVTAQDKIFFTRNVHTMLEAGIGLDQAIKTTADQITNTKFQAALIDMHVQLQQGQTLYSVLMRHPAYFNTFYTNMVRVGESSGKLDEVLGHLLEQQERDEALRSKAKSAMIYPSIILVALILMVTLMMVYVIPKVAGVLEGYDVSLPLATRILMGISSLFVHQGIYLLLGSILLVLGFRRWLKSPRGRERWDLFLLSLPRIKNIVSEFNLAIFNRSLSALIQSGVQLDQALILSSQVCPQTQYRTAAKDGAHFIQKGVPLAEVLKGHPKLYPPLNIRMVEVGQRTGKLDYMLKRLAVNYEQSVETSLTNLSSVIEPALLLLIGLTVGFVAIAVMTPIWKFSATV